MGRIGDMACVPALIEAMADEDPQVRATAASSISALTHDSLRPNIHGTPNELRAEAEACRKHWLEQCEKG